MCSTKVQASRDSKLGLSREQPCADFSLTVEVGALTFERRKNI